MYCCYGESGGRIFVGTIFRPSIVHRLQNLLVMFLSSIVLDSSPFWCYCFNVELQVAEMLIITRSARSGLYAYIWAAHAVSNPVYIVSNIYDWSNIGACFGHGHVGCDIGRYSNACSSYSSIVELS